MCRIKPVNLICMVAMMFLAPLASLTTAQELVSNSTFTSSASDSAPSDWSIWRPDWAAAGCRIECADEGVLMEAGENPYAVGGLFQEVGGVHGGQAYRIEVQGQIQDLPDPYGTLLVRLLWLQGGKTIHPAGMLIRGPVWRGELVEFKDVLLAPTQADGARLSLEAKWLQGGSVLWQRANMNPCDAPADRKVRIGSVYLKPKRSTRAKNLELWCSQIDRAGELDLDIVCLGEVITKVGTPSSFADCAEPIPGPASKRLGQAARRNRIWVVAGLTELDGEDIYNTAVLLDRQGNLAGTYRKVHLPREEWRQGIRPGHDYPVFKTDFGTIAMQICYDWFFPEPEAIFAQQGAEIIFAPTWGNTLPDAEGCVDGETTFRVRARDNGVYMVPSVYSGNSLVIGPRGRILASSQGKEGVFWAEVDLSQREPLPFVGYWRSIGPRHRRHVTFDPLTREQGQPNY